MQLIGRRSVVVVTIGVTQTLAWASSYYLPAILADQIAASLNVGREWIFGAFSASLLLAAFLGPVIGRSIDRRGGRGVLVLSNLLLAAGLTALSQVTGLAGLFTAWAVLGIGMALGLYDTAFATLATLYGRQARGPITGITLIAGFASTIGWPLTALFEAFFNDLNLMPEEHQAAAARLEGVLGPEGAAGFEVFPEEDCWADSTAAVGTGPVLGLELRANWALSFL